MKRLVVIGGGAGGMACAVCAARGLRSRGADGVEVVVLEADERVGRSILATGNGRCNFSNAQLDPSRYRNAGFVAAALEALDARRAVHGPRAPGAPEDLVHAFFSDLGLEWREESEGRLYPLANKASSVLDVLRAAGKAAGVREACGRRAVRIDAPRGRERCFHVQLADGAVEQADAVVVATGGRGIDALGLPAALPVEATRPVLGPLRTDTALTRRLNNIRVRCEVSLEDAAGALKARERGELLFRDYGVSGICVFNLSRDACIGDVLSIDMLPGMDAQEAEGFLHARHRRMVAGRNELTCEDFLRGLVLPQVGEVLAGAAGLRGGEVVARRDVSKLARAATGLRLEVRGLGDARQCQAVRGGLEPSSFDPKTMQARSVPGLYAVGEALDVDGPCGGYNLHWAWASGMLAASAALGRLGIRAAGEACF